MKPQVLAAQDSPAFNNVVELRTPQSLIDLEFSEIGRDPRFPSGWWLAPLLVIMPAVVSCAALIFFNWMRG